ncbi:unnamed protein product [Vitrella brassicaformis CCMP3155]|uniref:Uncharacterized protein n=1 Tax=Vitrella brassicaformis (strain CCMP3155) TaxID=1169540 RepID=A0A0G4H632_VITBC|nr:unnamed protein product [Vitrella brassicaformis CCMP3155]|eukprot:CEM39323.1 unnamed protein product [Vitrella brassicaformis CCMP3155]
MLGIYVFGSFGLLAGAAIPSKPKTLNGYSHRHAARARRKTLRQLETLVIEFKTACKGGDMLEAFKIYTQIKEQLAAVFRLKTLQTSWGYHWPAKALEWFEELQKVITDIDLTPKENLAAVVATVAERVGLDNIITASATQNTAKGEMSISITIRDNNKPSTPLQHQQTNTTAASGSSDSLTATS